MEPGEGEHLWGEPEEGETWRSGILEKGEPGVK